MKFKRAWINILVGVGSQAVIMLLGIIVPRLVITNYGSDVNGLFNSISQIYSYVALLEAGIGASTLQALYRYIGNNNSDDINGLLAAAHNYYKKVSFIYSLCVIVGAITFSLIAKTEINRWYVFVIFLVQGIAGVLNFRFLAAEKIYLTAEGKQYVASSTAMIVSVITSIVKIILVNLKFNIVGLQIVYCCINVGQLLFYYIYFRKKYKWFDLKVKPKYDALYQKNHFLINEIAWTVFSCTDTILLSVFCDLKVVSVYAIYNLVFSSLSNLLNAFYTGTQFVLSRAYHENKEQYAEYHDTYDSIFVLLIYTVMAVCYFVITPFIRIYTRGVTDITYVDKYLPLLFCLVQILSWIRYVSGNLTNISGHVNNISKVSIAETVINLSVSLVLVNILGIYGVLLGTIAALLFKSNYLIVYANRKILERSAITTYKTIAGNSLLFIAVIIVKKYVEIIVDSYFMFLLDALVAFVVIFIAFFIVNCIINYRFFRFAFRIVINKIKKVLKKA